MTFTRAYRVILLAGLLGVGACATHPVLSPTAPAPGAAVACIDAAALDLRRLLAPPPADGSPETRAELDELMRLQAVRTAAQAERARGDAALSLTRLAEALGTPVALTEASAPKTLQLVAEAAAAENAVVGPGKDRFARHRPYVLEPRLEPIVTRPTTASYPSGHAAWAYTVGLVLADLVPERRGPILARAEEFARNRSVAGVHYLSDVRAGEIAGTAVAAALFACAAFRQEEAAAAPELRGLLGLPSAPAAAP